MWEIKYLKQKELKKLFNVIKNSNWIRKFYLRDLLIFNIAYYCWLRISELSLIKLEDYNKDNAQLYIRRLKWSNNSIIILDKERKLLLNKYIRIYNIKNDNELLFKSKNWKAMTKSNIEALVRYYKNKSNLINFHFHMLKHSIAVHLLEIWLSIFELKQYLGHKNINSTMIYSSFSTLMQKEMYKKIENKWLV